MKKEYKLQLIGAWLAGVILSVLTLVAFLKGMEPDTLYWTRSPLITALHAASAAALVLTVALPFFLPKEKEPLKTGVPNGAASILFSALLGFLFIGDFVKEAIAFFSKNGAAQASYAADAYGRAVVVLERIGGILAIFCAAFFLVSALRKTLSKSSALCLLETATLVWFALRLITMFIDTSAHTNLAGRRLSLVAIALCVLFFISEARHFAPREEEAKQKTGDATRYRAFGLAAIVALLPHAVPTLFLPLFGSAMPSASVLSGAIELAAALYITSHLILFLPEK